MRYQTAVLSAALMAAASSLLPATYAAAQDQLLLAPPTTGSCTIKKTEYATLNGFDESASTSFTGLPSVTTTFTQKKSGCVTGVFYANAGAETSGNELLLEILLDGTQCAPLTGGYVFANAGTDFSSHSVGYFCGTNVAAGTHTITVEYASLNGGKVAFYQRSLTVAHN